ncbi:MAG TPA: hypothetical protein PKL73_06105 [Polyangiaceae bacterium]|nr:MAG: hypothetical protein BWY17_03188 [Deltaproteobacteria bacterium ADurb.Bin207]HNS96505.1 hypothetical protein [Polyangiaceae bacterium]HNZ24054.1 hypothetical protein [Polyangiaceae bacterium]HOD21845.1 hypothetical protein [Polyangiaceae bacterium]HOE49911.1 hypothetical protein [Polyangiaceae bacterium]
MNLAVSKLFAPGLASAAMLWTATASAYCPCYTASSSSNTHNCGVEAAPGKNPSIAEWQDIFDLVAQGPSVWGSKGPDVADIGQGCGKPEPTHSVAAKFPCELLKAIAMAESGWKQFCVPESPSDQVGPPERTIISFDCGYGVGQVTSGMHSGETPAYDRQRVAADATYNLATGTQILASKWRATKCVGDNQPSTVEHWYTATWAYNGLAWINNPNNPNHDANRGVYNPSVGGSYTYQEKVFGRIEHPPSGGYWPSIPLAYPDRADCGSGGAPPALPEPNCASPTDCSHTRSTHTSTCFPGPLPDGGSDSGQAGASGAAGSAGAGGVELADANEVEPETGPPEASLDSAGDGGWGGQGGSAGKSSSTYHYQAEEPDGCACRAAGNSTCGPWALVVSLLGAISVLRRRRGS